MDVNSIQLGVLADPFSKEVLKLKVGPRNSKPIKL